MVHKGLHSTGCILRNVRYRKASEPIISKCVYRVNNAGVVFYCVIKVHPIF